MSDEEEKPPFAAALKFLTDQERRLLADHPAPRQLAAYHAGELAPEAEARIREHLALCRDCSDLLLDLAGFKKLTPPPGVPELTDEEVEEDWQAVRARMGEGVAKEPARVAEVVPIRPAPGITVRDRGVLPWKMAAAALMIVSVSLGLWVMALMRGPRSEGGTGVIFDSGEQVRGAEDQVRKMSSRQTGVFVFNTPESYDSFEGEIRESNEVVWRLAFEADQISVDPETQIRKPTFFVPAGSLRQGSYAAYLFGFVKGRRERIGRIEFEVHDR